jgi:hypothetical protein
MTAAALDAPPIGAFTSRRARRLAPPWPVRGLATSFSVRAGPTSPGHTPA